MLFRLVLPLVFVGLWSSAFVTAKVGVVYATPFAMLLARFSIVSLVFVAMLLVTRMWLLAQRQPQRLAPTVRTPAAVEVRTRGTRVLQPSTRAHLQINTTAAYDRERSKAALRVPSRTLCGHRRAA